MYAQSHDKMQKEEEFVGSLANGTQADNDEKAESGDGENSDLDEFRVKTSWSQAEEERKSECWRVPAECTNNLSYGSGQDSET